MFLKRCFPSEANIELRNALYVFRGIYSLIENNRYAKYGAFLPPEQGRAARESLNGGRFFTPEHRSDNGSAESMTPV
jgi:hypothetical protein